VVRGGKENLSTAIRSVDDDNTSAYVAVMDTQRKAATFKLSEKARALLIDLARRRGISQAAVLELLIRAEAKKDGGE
jgi:hypothetical protein